jgi:hypothetical protein
MSRTPYSAFEENVMLEILAVGSDWLNPLWKRAAGLLPSPHGQP